MLTRLREYIQVSFLQALSATGAAHLRALSIVCALWPLSDALLEDLPCTLPSLQYLEWGSTFYTMERMDGRLSAVQTSRPRPRRYGPRSLWVDDTILDHFGDAARLWY